MFSRFGMMRDVASIERALELLKGLKAKTRGGEQLADELVALGQKLGYVKNDVEAEHLRKDWFSRWFPKSPVAQIFVDGLILGAQKMLEGKGGPLPMVVYWAAGADKQVKIAVAQSDYQVTLVIITPKKPATKREVLLTKKKEPVWIVSSEDGQRVTRVQNVMTQLKLA